MRIVGLRWQGYCIPLKKPYVTAQGIASHRYGILVFLTDEKGRVGMGEASAIGPATLKETRLLASAIANIAQGLVNSSRITSAWPLSLSGLRISSTIRFGLETAMSDLQGIARGLPLAKLMGGSELQLPINALITSESVPDAIRQAKDAQERGFTSIKLKVGMRPPEKEEELISSIREEVGMDMKLRIDANQAWNTAQAIAILLQLARYDLEYVEQPVPATDIVGLSEVRKAVPIPVAADEAVSSVANVDRLLAAEAADVLVLKLGRVGGLATALEIMNRAEKAGKKIVVTSSLESGVGIVASAHLASILTSHPFAHGVATGSLLETDLLSDPVTLKGGFMFLPESPGLGISLDEDALGQYSIDVSGFVGISPR